jgi:hypothetical protein
MASPDDLERQRPAPPDERAWRLDRIHTGIEEADRGDFASDAEVARVRRKFDVRAGDWPPSFD